MLIQKKTSRKSAVKASNRAARRRRRAIRAAEEMEEEDIDIEEPEAGEGGDVDVAPEASDLLFEAEDVADLVAEVTGEEVAVTVDDDIVTFAVGKDEFIVEPEGDEEILESTKRPLKNKASVKASRKAAPRRTRKAVRR